MNKLINKKFKQLDKLHQNAMRFIKEALTEDCKWRDVRGIVRWLLTTDANPYSYMQEPWSRKIFSAEGLETLIHHIRHAIYDDGDCTIVTVNDAPRIVFHNKHEPNFKELVLSEFEKRLIIDCKPLRDVLNMEGEQYEIKILDIDINDFGKHYDAWYETDLKRCFMLDAEYHGTEFAIKHYSEYQLFKPEWAMELKEDK